MHIITTDIYEGAYLMTQNMQLEKLWLNGKNGRRKVVFQFMGNNVNVLHNQYQKGRVEANIIKYKQNLNELKDRMFDLMRTGEERRKYYEPNQFTVRS